MCVSEGEYVCVCLLAMVTVCVCLLACVRVCVCVCLRSSKEGGGGVERKERIIISGKREKRMAEKQINTKA